MFTAPPTIDIGFTLACAAIVFLMQAGFCLLESGLVRTKNSINVAVKNVLDCGISILMFALFGFAVMFGTSYHGFVGESHGVSITADKATTAFFLFQMVFCSTAATIVSGAVAERIRLWVFVAITAVLSGLVYPIFGHWAWGGALSGTHPGWLASLGFVDYAGCVVVHVVGGSAALAAAQAIGRRRHLERRDVTGGHSLTLSILGCFLLWFGWWGFNGGSGLAIDEALPSVLLNTNLAAVTGGLTAAFVTLMVKRRVEVGPLINGTLAGLVAITGACHAVSPFVAIVAGAIGALVCHVTERILIRIGIDDAVGAFAVHGIPGIWGAAVFALFAPLEMLVEGGRISQLIVQLGGALLAAAMSFGVISGFLHVLKRFARLRVRAAEERAGLNMVEHGATSEVIDLLGSMHSHEVGADYSKRLLAEPHTEVGQVAAQYNRVLDRVENEMASHQETNASLEQERLRLRSVVDNAGVGIYQIDPSGKFISANATLLEVLDCADAAHLIDQDHYTIPPWHRPGTTQSEIFRGAFQQGREIRGHESLIKSQQGIERWVLESFVPIRDETGRLICFLGTVQDVTDRKQAMLAEVEIAEAKSQAKGEFLANMSHEIRTPLNGVIGMLDLICSLELNDQAGHYASVARSSADTLLSLVNDILDFSKIEAGHLEIEQIEFDLRDTIERTAEQFAVMAHRKGLDMNCDISKGVGSVYQGDPERLRQVITNLLGNAIKFTESGEINLRVAHRGQMVRFSVQDTGIGMKPETVDKLFEAFTQADASTTRQYGGTGLGLSISSQLVGLMGGHIEVESQEGEGSTFWFEIDLPVMDRGADWESTNRQLASLPPGLRVLIVDDNTTNCEILSAQLTMWGLDVSVCQQSAAAVERMIVAQRVEKPFDLVILDFCMPEMNGEQVARSIRQQQELGEIPILMLSSNHELLSPAQLEDAGVQIALTKPARQSRLLDSVIALLRNSEVPGLTTQTNRTVGTSHRGNEQDAAKPVSADRSSPPPRQQEHESAARDEPIPSAIPTPSSVETSERPRKADVLVAEDNHINQLVVEQMLDRIGLSCELVDDGQKAFDRIKTGSYSLVLMDGHMPVLDGLAATKAIRKWEVETNSKRTPIVALTANVVAGVRQQCLNAGMDDYLCKPIAFETLENAVMNFIRDDSARDEARAESTVETVEKFVEVDEKAKIDRDAASTVSHVSPPVLQPAADDWAEEEVLSTGSWQSDRASGPNVDRSSTEKPHVPPTQPTSTEPSEDDVPLFERIKLDETCGFDESFVKQILGIMRDSLSERLEEIESAICAGDLARVRSVAHKLKGAAGDSALTAVYETAASVETLALDRDADGVSNYFDVLRDRVDRTQALLNQLID